MSGQAKQAKPDQDKPSTPSQAKPSWPSLSLAGPSLLCSDFPQHRSDGGFLMFFPDQQKRPQRPNPRTSFFQLFAPLVLADFLS